MEIKGAIFDFDGTLFDSMYIWHTYGDKFLERRKLRMTERSKMMMRSMTLNQAAVLFKEECGLSESVQEIMDDINRMVEDDYIHKVLPKPGVTEVLEKFKNAGVKMCIATATDRYQIEAALKRCGLDGCFEEIFTCTEAGCGKDDPKIFTDAHKLLGTEKGKTFVFEDALYAINTAKGIGLKTVGVYDEYAEHEEEGIKKEADIYIGSYDELWQYVSLPE